MQQRLVGLPSFTRFSRQRQGRWMSRSMQEMRLLHHPPNFLQTPMSPLSRPSFKQSPPNFVRYGRWISTQTTSTQAENNHLESSELSRVTTYVGLLEYLRKNHLIEGMRLARGFPEMTVRQAIEKQFLHLPTSQLLEMAAVERLEILKYLRVINVSDLSLVEKVKEWLTEVKRMHEEERIGSDEGRVLVYRLICLMRSKISKQTLKQDFEELYQSDLIQKKDYQSLAEYLNYLLLLGELRNLLQINSKDDFSDLLRFQDEMSELSVLESLRLFEHQRSLLGQEIDHRVKELIAALIRKSLSSNLILSVSDVYLIMDISEAIGSYFTNSEASKLMHQIRDKKLNLSRRMQLMMILSNSLKSFQSCDDELASFLKEKLNAIIMPLFWRYERILPQKSNDFFTFVKNIDSAFLTSSSHILFNNIGKELKAISGDDLEIIISTIPSYLQGDQVEVNQLIYLMRLVDLNITIDYFPESTKTLMMELLVNYLQEKNSPIHTTQVLVLLSKLQYGWNDFPRHVQELFAESLSSGSLKFNEIIGFMRCLPILCFDSEQIMDVSLDSPLMKVIICLLKSKDLNNDNIYIIEWLKILPLNVQNQLLSGIDIPEIPTKIIKPSLIPYQKKFIKECNHYLSQHLVRANDMKDRKIVISSAHSSIKSFPMHLTIECDGKVVVCIQLLKERIKVKGGEMKMDREDMFQDYVCYHTYGDVPIIPIEFEDYSKLEVGEEMFKEIENIVRSLIQ